MASIVSAPAIPLSKKLSLIDKITEKTNKKYGKTIIGRIANNSDILDTLKIKYIKTPCAALNAAVGGGLPRRRCTLIAGLSDSGKTSFVLETIAYAMKDDENFTCLWLESENSLELDYIVNTFGIDPERFVFLKFDQGVGAEETLDLVKGILETGSIDLFCINSLKCLIPTKEVEASLTEHLVGVQARFNARLSRKFTALVAEHNTAFVIITHLSTEIGSLKRD